MLSSRAVTVGQCCNAESALTAQALLLRSVVCRLTRRRIVSRSVCLFVCLSVRFLVWFVRFGFAHPVGYFVQVGINATLIIYAYYILTGYVNKMLMSPIVALTYNQVKCRAHH